MSFKMRRLLLLGGMTPDVTSLYYNGINRIVKSRLGGRNGAPMYSYSTNLEKAVQHAGKGEWSEFAEDFLDPIRVLTAGEQPKVDGVCLSAILAHKVSREMTEALEPSGIPFLHIADILAEYLKVKYPDFKTLGLLGPKPTMLESDDPDFFIGRLQTPKYGYKVLVPETAEEINEVARGVIEEVALGAQAVTEKTKNMFVQQAKALITRGAQAILLGSTDLGFVIKQEDIGDQVMIIDPALVHIEAVAEWILEGVVQN